MNEHIKYKKMDIKELKIGNWIKAIEKESFYEVKGINEITIDVQTDKPNTLKRYLLDGFEGIQINEEWLLKFGFVKNDLLFNIVSKAYEFEIDLTYESSLFFRLKKCNNGWVEIFNINYIHQLQNLYFALTQKEL